MDLTEFAWHAFNLSSNPVELVRFHVIFSAIENRRTQIHVSFWSIVSKLHEDAEENDLRNFSAMNIQGHATQLIVHNSSGCQTDSFMSKLKTDSMSRCFQAGGVFQVSTFEPGKL